MAKALQLPSRSDFGWQCIGGPHRVDPAAMVSPSPCFGLVKVSQAAYGCVRDDETGALNQLLRIFPSGTGRPDKIEQRGAFLLMTSWHHEEDCLRIHPVSADAAPSAAATPVLSDGTGIWASGKQTGKREFELRVSTAGLEWREEGIIDLKGTLVGPGLHWYMPGLDVGMYWVSQLFELSGTVMGRSVRGMMGLDEAYMPEGGIVEKVNDTLVGKAVHRTWYTWATRYKDGTLDGGHFLVGHDLAGFALLTNEMGEPSFTTDVEADILTREAFGHTWPESIRLAAGGEEWEFLPDPCGAMPDILGEGALAATSQHEGRWRRVGDQREPDVWFAFGEIAPQHGLQRVQRYRYR